MEQILINKKIKSSKSSNLEQMEQTGTFQKTKSSTISKSDSVNYDHGTNGTKFLTTVKSRKKLPTSTIISLCSEIEMAEQRMVNIAVGYPYDIRKLYEVQLCDLYKQLMIYVEKYDIGKIENGIIHIKNK